MWQFRHIHTLYFETNTERQTYCPRCGDIYQKRNFMSETPTSPKSPKSPKSTLVLSTMILLISAFVTLFVAVIFSLPYALAVAGLQGLAAITFAVLSLRETA